MTRRSPDAKRSISAPSVSSPSNSPSTPSPSGNRAVSAVPTGCARSIQRARTGGQPLPAPTAEPAGEGFRQRLREIGGGDGDAVRGEAGGRAVGEIRVVREVHADPDDDRIVGAFEQDAAEFRAAQQEVVGPFELQTTPAKAGAQ